jgi:hypothetical protein
MEKKTVAPPYPRPGSREEINFLVINLRIEIPDPFFLYQQVSSNFN